jgi:hypothetical protein
MRRFAGRPGRGALLLSLLLFPAASLLAQETSPLPPPAPLAPEGYVLVKTIVLPGTVDWIDSGLEVKPGDELFFEAEGSVSIQKGNPVAACGPEGLSLRTMQQPIPDRNLGCVIGMVVIRTDVIEDKETKEKTEKRWGEPFPIGRGGAAAPAEAGRLWLGINENLTGDNEGAFTIRVYLRPPG